MAKPLTWEPIKDRYIHRGRLKHGETMTRAKVPGGWLVATENRQSIAFVPDPQHQWPVELASV